MKRLFICAGILSLTITACNNADKKESTAAKDTATVSTADTSTKTVATPAAAMPDSATMMKNWQNYMAVSDVHKMMAGWSGTWAGDVTMWQYPGAAPEKSKATTVNKMIMGGRYQLSYNSGNMMGMPFEGQSTLGYDNAKKIFISTWIDNMGTGIMVLKGPWDAATKSMTLTGPMVDPGTGEEKNIRETFTVIDDKTQLMEMFCNGPDGKEFKTMEIKYSKK